MVWFVTGSMNVLMLVNDCFFAYVQVSMLDGVEHIGCFIKKIPVMGDNYVGQFQFLQYFYEVASGFRIKVVCWLIKK